MLEQVEFERYPVRIGELAYTLLEAQFFVLVQEKLLAMSFYFLQLRFKHMSKHNENRYAVIIVSAGTFARMGQVGDIRHSTRDRAPCSQNAKGGGEEWRMSLARQYHRDDTDGV